MLTLFLPFQNNTKKLGCANTINFDVILVCICLLTNGPVVISLHLEIEDLALGVAGLGDEILVEKSQNISADLFELLLDLLAILFGHLLFALGSLGLLLDRGDHAPGAATGAHNIFVSHRKKIPDKKN